MQRHVVHENSMQNPSIHPQHRRNEKEPRQNHLAGTENERYVLTSN